MTDEEMTFEQYVAHQFAALGEIIEQHDFIIRALTNEITEIKRAIPDMESQEEPREAHSGETRGETTAYMLPDGYGTLLVYIKPDGQAKITVKNRGYSDTANITLQKSR